MSHALQAQVLDPSRLDPRQKQTLIDELYAAHAQIFDGVSKACFADYVVNSKADRTRIEVLRAGGQVVGYLAVHTFVREIEGQRWVVLRAESGKLPRYRRSTNGGLMIREILRACLRYPGARKAFLGCLVHPSSYLALGHVAPEIYPRCDEPTPAPIRAVMHDLAGAFGLERVDPACSGVRKVGWITRETEADRASWARRSDAMTNFFRQQNPGYVEGHGLVTLVPAGLHHLVEGSLRYLARNLRRRLDRALSTPAAAGRGQLA